MNKEEKTTLNIKAPHHDFEVLKKHFSHCFDKSGCFDFEKFKKQLQANTEPHSNFSKESYSLDWLGKSYARLLACDATTTLLKEDEEFNSKEENKDADNLLIKGDNLEVLKHLSNAYHEKIKMIYIDPPYNTGNDDFVYEDNRKFTAQQLSQLAGIEEEKAQRILDFTQSKSNSHSAWLTFMYPRLYIAKQLLTDDGVIFISIDDNEVAQLKLLMDEIFGEENFVAELICRKKAGGANDSDSIAVEHEYLLCYCQTKLSGIYQISMKAETLKKYKFKDAKFETRGFYLTKNLCDFSLKDSAGLHYDIICPDGTLLKGNDNQWKCTKETFQNRLNDDKIEFKKINNKWQVHYKIYLNEAKGELKYDSCGNIIQKKVNLSSILKVGLNSESAIRIKELFSVNIFKYSKPISLITELLLVGASTSDLILDFFAGSGTTGDAVMQLNAEDGGNRKYILVQIPEPIDPKKNQTAYNFIKEELKAEPTIFEITKERLIRAAKKIEIAHKEEIQNKAPLSETKDKLKKLKIGFKIFETIPIWENYDFEAEEFTNQLTLFDKGKLTDEDLKTLLTTWKTNDGILLTEALQKINVSSNYIAYYGYNKLYLLHTDFTTEDLKILLEKIDSDPNFNPHSIIAFGYHFNSKNLREIAENIKLYANKKHIDIDFITRY